MAMEGLRKELADVSVKPQAAAKRKLAWVPPLCKEELLEVRQLDAEPQSVYASLLAPSTLVWRREVPAHEYVRASGTRKSSPMSRLMIWPL